MWDVMLTMKEIICYMEMTETDSKLQESGVLAMQAVCDSNQ